MRAAVSTVFTAALLMPATAQRYLNQSAPFRLKLSSTNETLDGSYLFACHSGAAIEQLCVGDSTARGDDFDTFYYNTSDAQSNPMPDVEEGNLVWNMPYQINDTKAYESEPLNFFFSPVSNVAVLIFEPSDETRVYSAFDSDDNAFVTYYVDDSVTPPNAQAWKSYYHWQACTTYYGSYTRFVLAWGTGGDPVNPSCQAVNLTREFIDS